MYKHKFFSRKNLEKLLTLVIGVGLGWSREAFTLRPVTFVLFKVSNLVCKRKIKGFLKK